MWYVVVEMDQNMPKDLTLVRSEENRNRFHWLFLGGQASAQNRYDSVISETEHFVVLPSLGSLVAGWLLLVPKFPLGRIADLKTEFRDELEALVEQCIDKVESGFGRAFLFEHGGNKGSKVSCGVDQAHLHIVPLEFDLLGLATQSTRQSWAFKNGFVLPYDICGGDEYWYVSDQKRTISIAATEPKSQWFRKLIAGQTGQSHKWDYNEYPFYDKIDQTLKVMGVDA